MKEGMGTGHEEKYYQTADQRFLGDEQFVEEIASRAKDKEVQPGGPRVSFERLQAALAEEYGIDLEALVGTGRRKEWVQARRQLVWLARQWAKMTTRELGERLNRDASMISRLSREYEENRDSRGESKLARALSSKGDRIQIQA
jgi:chromosomal replication initiation ATPase DnaA